MVPDVMAQLVLYPASLHPGVYPRGRKAYIIRNARLDPDWAETEPRTLGIAARAISTMLAASGHNDVMRVYFVTQRDKVRADTLKWMAGLLLAQASLIVAAVKLL